MKKLIILGSCFLAILIAVYVRQRAPEEEAKAKALAPSGTSSFSRVSVRSTADADEAGIAEAFKNFQAVNGLPADVREQCAARLQNGDAAFLDRMLDHLKSETNPDAVKALTELILQNGSPAEVKRLSDLALDLSKNHEPERRKSAVAMCALLLEKDPSLLQSVGHIARTDADATVQMSAMETLEGWLRQSFGQEDQVAWEIIQTIKATTSPVIRARAGQALVMLDAQLSVEVLRSISDSWPHESEQDRTLAVSLLGRAADEAKDFALEQLENLYRTEKDTALKRTIASQMVSLGKNTGLDRLKQFSSEDPLLVQQMEDFLKMTQEVASQ